METIWKPINRIHICQIWRSPKTGLALVIIHLRLAFSMKLGQSYMDTLILTSLLVLMGISTFTSKEFGPFFAGYLADWQWLAHSFMVKSGEAHLRLRSPLQAPKEDVANGAWVHEKDVADIMGGMRDAMGMGMGITIWLWPTVCHGKSQFLSSVNLYYPLFPWAIYTMANC